jgi:hypothetical protein
MNYRGIGSFSLLFFLLLSVGPAPALADMQEPLGSDQTTLYRATFIRAAPGKLLELIDLFKSQMPVYDTSGDERPFWWRHTQGDQWDLMMLYPMESFSTYFSRKRVERRQRAQERFDLSPPEFQKRFQECSSWHEDIFVQGPLLKTVKKAFKDTSFYHCEIFIALPGKYGELHKERKMENAYVRGLGRPENLIFTRVFGASWDLFTLGCYKDMKQWAASSDISKEKRNEAAVKAGFDGTDQIGPYMRTLILFHRDTIGVAIK